MRPIHISIWLAIACALTACGSRGIGNRAEEASSASAQNASAVPQSPPIAFGRTGWVDGVEVTLTSVALDDDLQHKAGVTALEPGETYLIVRYQMKNVSGHPMDENQGPRIALVSPAGEPYIEDLMAGVVASRRDEDGWGRGLNPDVTARGVTAWRVIRADFDPAEWTVESGAGAPVAFALK